MPSCRALPASYEQTLICVGLHCQGHATRYQSACRADDARAEKWKPLSGAAPGSASLQSFLCSSEVHVVGGGAPLSPLPEWGPCVLLGLVQL